VVKGLLAMQAQDFPGAKWAVLQRMASADDAEVQRAYDEGRILRTHVLRPTWHFVAPADIRWLLELSAPRVHAANAYAYRLFGVDKRGAKRSNARIVKALERSGQLTRAELGRVLGAREGDVEVKAAGTRLACLVMRAELDGLICSGPTRDGQHTYALLEERAPPSPKLGRDEALAELARRYVVGHGPAQAKDLAWWSGLVLDEAKRALEACGSALERTKLDGKSYYQAPAPPVARRRTPAVHLLPNYDELLVAFKDRSAMTDFPELRDAPQVSVLRTQFVTVDGRVVGGWRRLLTAREVVVMVQLWRPLSSAERSGLERAAARYAESLRRTCRLETELVTKERSNGSRRR
jgi:hypothetical protein